MRGLEGKTAIVTGGATLIGAAVVRAFVAAGARVAVADIDEEGGGRLADELGDAVLFSPTDIRDDAQLEQLAAATAARFGGIDFLVNLACSYVDEGFASPRADWLESLNVNVASAAMAAKAVHPHMLARGGGAIVNFASISSKVAQTGRWLYPVSKAAIVQLTRNMAMDLAGDGIRVNSVSPGLDVVEGDGGADRATTARRRTAWPRLSTCSAASAIRRRWRTSSSSSAPTTRRSSPAPTTRSTAATRRWVPSRPSRRYPSLRNDQ